MIETLSKMSGMCHRSYREGKTVTSDSTSLFKFGKNEDKISYNMQTKEEPVISYNDMASIPPCNSIVFRAGDSPIWNRNETALPMSWRLFKNTIINPGKEYTLQTIPSLSTAKDFDVKQNQPNFMSMFEKRLNQAAKAERAMRYYQDVYGLTDDQIQKLDIDVYSDEIMELISQMLNPDVDLTVREEKANPDVLDVEPETTGYTRNAVPDDSVQKVIRSDPAIQKQKAADRKIYANGTISKNDLVSPTGINHSLDATISEIYNRLRNDFSSDPKYFRVNPQNNALSSTSGELYIYWQDNGETIKRIKAEAKKNGTKVYGLDDGTGKKVRNDMVVTDAFYRFLVSFDEDWPFARGQFSRQMANAQANGSVRPDWDAA